MVSLKISSPGDLPVIAKQFLESSKGFGKFAFYGKMGVGKTTLIKAICAELGVPDIVNSPSFAIVNEYRTVTGDRIFHFDLYRIKSKEELYDIGYEDYFYGDDYIFIEWPEYAEEILPENMLKVTIEELPDGSRLASFQN